MSTELHGNAESLGLAAGREVPKDNIQSDKDVAQLHRCLQHPLILLGPVRRGHMAEEHLRCAEEVMPKDVYPINLWKSFAKGHRKHSQAPHLRERKPPSGEAEDPKHWELGSWRGQRKLQV